MSTPAAADLSLCDRAVLLVLSDLLPVDSPRELTIPQIAQAAGLEAPGLGASLTALERAGLIQRLHPGPGCPPSILRPSTPLPVAAPSDAPPAPLPHPDAPPRPRSVAGALCDLFRRYPPDTVLTTSSRDLAAAIGRAYSSQINKVLAKLAQAGLVERLPPPGLRLRLCGPFPTSEGDAALEAAQRVLTQVYAAVQGDTASEALQPVLTQIRAALRGQPLGVALPITVKDLATAIGRSQMGVLRVLRILEAKGTLRRTVVGRRTGLILLKPLDGSTLSAPAPGATPPPMLPPAQRLTPHAALWQHLRASQCHRNPTDWLLSGVTVTVLPDTTVLTCVDAARTYFARFWHRTLVNALHALELPHTLVIQQAPADTALPLPPGALDAALATDSLGALLDAVKPLPNPTEQEARALLAQVQAGQAAQERQAALREPSADLAQAMTQGYAAWERLILSHVRLVVAVAGRIRSERLTLEERVQAGLLGLMQTIAQSDGRPSRPFFIVACRAIKRAVREARAAEEPLRRTRSQGKVAKARRELAASLGREPTVEEIARHAGMLPATVVAVLNAEAGMASLDAPLRLDEPVTLADLVADTQALTPEALLLAREAVQERRKALGGALAALEPEARRVLALRFGLEGEAHTVTEAARAMGWTVPRVQKAEAGALAALRAGMTGGVEGACS